VIYVSDLLKTHLKSAKQFIFLKATITISAAPSLTKEIE
jgi:hypothetical protein